MTEIPRKPTFPNHMIDKLIAKIQSEVNDDVIPVSTGIYSYQKLKNRLEAILKPEIENYDDKIFFEVIQDRLSPPDKTGQKCTLCEEEYNLKKNPAMMCNFCGFWCCNNCMPARKRPHPLSKDANGKRYNVCQRCDTKFLNLQLGHSYVQNRTLLQQAIAKTSSQLQAITSECRQYQQALNRSKQTFQKNKFKIAQIKKEKLDLNKDIKTKLPEQIKLSEAKTQQLKQKFIEVHLKHKQWMQMSQSRKRIWQQEKQRQRKQKQQREKQQQQKQILRKLKQKEEKQQAQRIQRENLQVQRQRQSELEKIDKMKKTQSLSQNNTVNLSLSLNSSQRLQNNPTISQQQVRDEVLILPETHTKVRKLSIQNHHQDALSCTLNQLPSKQNLSENKIPQNLRQSQAFREYFTQHTTQKSQNQEEQYFSHKYKASNKKIFDGSQEKTQQKQEEGQKIKNKKDVTVSNFTFDQKIIEQLKPQQSTWHYHQKERKKSQNFDNLQESQFTFDKNKQNKYLQENGVRDLQAKKDQKIQQSQLNQHEQDNHLSFADQWYINKKIVPQNQSTLSSVLNGQSYYEKPYIAEKRKKTPEELEQQCTKSTSEMDEEQIQVARYSLLKAARDSAVQQRQKNKIYQRSIYEMAPQDQEEQAVGEIKKCQCSIF